jgi:esterase/lipase superfamily enzyme
MYVVTNRKVNTRKEGLDLFGDTPNTVGPNELRLVKVTKQGSHYTTELLADRLTQAEVRELKRRHALDIDERADWYASLKVACELMEQAAREKRHLLIYVHGYNNDMRDLMGTAGALEALYDVIVVPFSWPANGGGTVTGTAAYLEDKRDARVSMDALNRFLGKVGFYLETLTEARRRVFWEQATADDQGRGNRGAIQARYAHLLDEDCKVTVNLMCHSMGNYVLKYALQPSAAASAKLIFDNVSLVAADANNENHQSWIERIQVRNRLYVVINENDFALGWARRKPGQEQGPRLGHYLKNLTARNTRYLDITHADAVGNAHGYFAGEPVARNARLKTLFKDAFEGGRAEDRLPYAADINAYRLS